MSEAAGQDAEGSADRAAFRAFVRRHHPDVGGDPAEFAEGLARFRRALAATEQPDRTGTDEDDRYDAPVVFVAKPTGAARFTAGVKRWRRRRRRPPRVR